MVDVPTRTDFPRTAREIENTWIPMPDGTRLAARIWLPDDAESDPVPAILEYLPYRKRDGTVERDQLTHPYFAGFGYGGVRVDMRGTGDSEGVCLGEYLEQEQDDALAVIEWLAAQSWCSGKVGMIGISWGGFNGLQIAARQPEALGAVITLCSTDDRYADDIHYMGGAMLTDNLAWGSQAFVIANTPPDPAIVGQDRWRDMWIERLENNGLWMLDWFRHQRRDDFYEHGSICQDYNAVKVPVYAVGGYADGYTNPVFRMMQNLSCQRKGLVGPWAHQYPHFASPGPRIGFLQECLRWWDQHLKGVETGVMQEPMIRAWMQEPTPPSPVSTERPGRWISVPSWPDPEAQSKTLHVTTAGLSDCVASTDPIQIDCPETAGKAAQNWFMYGTGPDGPLDQNGEVGLMRHFETSPLADDLEIFGHPMLYASVVSDVPQANIVAVLSLVAPNGSATLISYGTLNLTHRNSHGDPEPLPVSQPVSATVQLNVIGQRVPAGYRLRLALSQAYWPVLWPSQQKARLTLTDVRLHLPLHHRSPDSPVLEPFKGPEGAAPLATEILSDGFDRRDLRVDYATGVETYTRAADTGRELHLHTGSIVRYENEERFDIHPDDPNSAQATCTGRAHHSRGDWHTEVDTMVRVQALPDVWRITAWLEAHDGTGVALRRDWQEDIPRDHV